jgi:hypothetical protein
VTAAAGCGIKAIRTVSGERYQPGGPKMRRIVASIAVVVSIPWIAAPVGAVECDGRFHVQRHPARDAADLHDVEIVSRDDAWAVGVRLEEADLAVTLVERWNGTRWRIVPSPNPGRTSPTHVLNDVSAAGPSDVWAVGTRVTSRFVDKPLVEHWDGSEWTAVRASSVDGVLHGVVAIAPDDVWAGGSFLPRGEAPRALLLHWDGRRWDQVFAPVAGVETVTAMDATGPDDVWAVGRLQAEGGVFAPFIKHWDGVAWSNVPVPPFGPNEGLLWSVAAIARDDAWAVGSRGQRAVALHWNGGAWTRSGIVHPSENSTLFDVAAPRARAVWVVGAYLNDAERQRPFAERWDGTAWQRVGVENATRGDNGLVGIDARRRQRWAVGFGQERSTGIAVIQRSCAT